MGGRTRGELGSMTGAFHHLLNRHAVVHGGYTAVTKQPFQLRQDGWGGVWVCGCVGGDGGED